LSISIALTRPPIRLVQQHAEHTSPDLPDLSDCPLERAERHCSRPDHENDTVTHCRDGQRVRNQDRWAIENDEVERGDGVAENSIEPVGRDEVLERFISTPGDDQGEILDVRRPRHCVHWYPLLESSRETVDVRKAKDLMQRRVPKIRVNETYSPTGVPRPAR